MGFATLNSAASTFQERKNVQKRPICIGTGNKIKQEYGCESKKCMANKPMRFLVFR